MSREDSAVQLLTIQEQQQQKNSIIFEKYFNVKKHYFWNIDSLPTLVNKTLCVDLTCYVFWFTVLEAKFPSCEKQFKRLRFSSGLVPYCEGTAPRRLFSYSVKWSEGRMPLGLLEVGESWIVYSVKLACSYA